MADFSAIDHSLIRYSKVWEDFKIAAPALDLKSTDSVGIVSSAGCNLLHLMALNVRQVWAFDLSESQIALSELKIVACRNLAFEQYMMMLGYQPSQDRALLYKSIEDKLSLETKRFWDANEILLDRGIQSSGRLDKYFSSFWANNNLVKKILESELHKELFTSLVEELEHLILYDVKLEHDFKIYFGRDNMEKNGRHPSQFKYVDLSLDLGASMLKKIRHAVRTFGILRNPFMQAFLFGRYLSDVSFGDINSEAYERASLATTEVIIEKANFFEALLKPRITSQLVV